MGQWAGLCPREQAFTRTVVDFSLTDLVSIAVRFRVANLYTAPMQKESGKPFQLTYVDRELSQWDLVSHFFMRDNSEMISCWRMDRVNDDV